MLYYPLNNTDQHRLVTPVVRIMFHLCNLYGFSVGPTPIIADNATPQLLVSI